MTRKCASCGREVVSGLRNQRTAMSLTYGPGDEDGESGWPRESKEVIKRSKWNPFSAPRMIIIEKVNAPKDAPVFGGTCRICHQTVCILCVDDYIHSRMLLSLEQKSQRNVRVSFTLLNTDGTLYGCPLCQSPGHTVDAL